MREKDFQNLTNEGKQLWIFNRLNNHVEKTSMNVWAFYAIMTTSPMIYLMMIFQLLTYNAGEYRYLVDNIYPLLVFGTITILAGVCSMILSVVDSIIRWWKDYKLKRDYTKNGSGHK